MGRENRIGGRNPSLTLNAFDWLLFYGIPHHAHKPYTCTNNVVMQPTEWEGFAVTNALTHKLKLHRLVK